MLGIFLAKANAAVGEFSIPGLADETLLRRDGTGNFDLADTRIIKAVGMDMVKLERYQGFSADLRPAPDACFCLL